MAHYFTSYFASQKFLPLVVENILKIEKPIKSLYLQWSQA